MVGPKVSAAVPHSLGFEHVCAFLTSSFHTHARHFQGRFIKSVSKLREKLPCEPNMSQPKSALLRLPAELRHQVYLYILPDGIHIRLHGSELNLSPCLEQPQPRTSPHVGGYERKPDGYGDILWGRRLDSTWGPHWMCEEHVSTITDKFDLTLALVCKSM